MRSSDESRQSASTASLGYAQPRTGRDNGGRAVVGNAVSRTTYPYDGYVSFPIYGPWGYNYPWYGSAFGWGLGYVYYDPWRYRGTMWGWGRYGMWYDPWGYYPYDPFMYGGGGGGGGGSEYSGGGGGGKTTGSIRLKANVKEAKVYVDGALYGTVDEFDGLTDHLELDGGRHTLELRADGHETYRKEIVVDSGKTVTHRASLKNLKKK